MPTPKDLEGEPVHKYLDHTNLFPGIGIFTFVLRSGGDFQVYIMNPDHAKQIAKLFTKRVEEYEKEYGPLVGRLQDEPMMSPVKMDPPQKDIGL
jgi:hypothetical protein